MMSTHARRLWTTAALLLMALALGPARAQPQNCPQPRFTGQAPPDYLAKVNPLQASEAHSNAAQSLFLGKERSANCAICHGPKGEGNGPLANLYDPPPRNFACAKTIDGVPDGQLFWIIRFGSPGTAMPPHPRLNDGQVWQMVLYLRQLAR
jgi:mono/diheme cytochrome c family protein